MVVTCCGPIHIDYDVYWVHKTLIYALIGVIHNNITEYLLSNALRDNKSRHLKESSCYEKSISWSSMLEEAAMHATVVASLCSRTPRLHPTQTHQDGMRPASLSPNTPSTPTHRTWHSRRLLTWLPAPFHVASPWLHPAGGAAVAISGYEYLKVP